MPLVDIDGVIIDDDTGEIVEKPEGFKQELLAWLQIQHRNASEQDKGWSMEKGALNRALLRHMGEVRRIQNGDLVSSVRGGGATRTFLRDKWREDMEAVELTLADWRDIALNLLDTDTPPPGMSREEFERRYVQFKARSKYVYTEPVKQPARAKVVQ